MVMTINGNDKGRESKLTSTVVVAILHDTEDSYAATITSTIHD